MPVGKNSLARAAKAATTPAENKTAVADKPTAESAAPKAPQKKAAPKKSAAKSSAAAKQPKPKKAPAPKTPTAAPGYAVGQELPVWLL